MVCHTCMYNHEYAADEAAPDILEAVTFYNGFALCTVHWSDMVERNMLHISENSHRPDNKLLTDQYLP